MLRRNRNAWVAVGKNVGFTALLIAGGGGLFGWLLSPNQLTGPRRLARLDQTDESFQHTVRDVNDQWRDHWASLGLEAAGPADDLIVCRRLALGLMGTVPSLEEIRAIEAQPAGHRVEWYLARILNDRRFGDHVGERLVRAMVGVDDGQFILFRRRRFDAWVSDHLVTGTRYDDLVRRIIAGEGLWTSDPEVNFLTGAIVAETDRDPDPVKLAGRFSRAFLGMRIDCLECHDDNLGTMTLGSAEDPEGGLEQHFHGLAAFFGQTKRSAFGILDDPKRSYRHTFLHETDETVVEPTVPFRPDLLGTEGTARQRLANWVTSPQHDAFARATVNRIWAIVTGRPLVAPVDDLPLMGPYPPGLERLADDFVSHGYDLKRLIRLIVASDVVRRDSRADFPVTLAHDEAWAVYPLVRLRPEQMAGAILQATGLRTVNEDAHILLQLERFFGELEFIKRYGDGGVDEFAERGGTIPQRLLLMNGNMIRDRTKPGPLESAAGRIGALAPTIDTAIETTYLCVLTRRPTGDELTHFRGRLDGTTGDARRAAVSDLFWSLLNASEFSWNH